MRSPAFPLICAIALRFAASGAAEETVSGFVLAADTTTRALDTDSVAPPLDRMIVRTRRFESHSPSVRHLRAEEFAGQYQDLPSLLEGSLGLTVRRVGTLGEYAEASVRGSDSKHLQVYLDGLPLGSASGGGVDLSKIPIGSLQEISVYTGAPPLELSTRSPGGAIDLTSLGGTDFIAANAEVGGYGVRKGSMLLRRKWGKLTNQISGDYGQAENNYPFPYDPTGEGVGTVIRKSNNHFWFTSAFATAEYAFSEARKIFSMVRYDGYDKGLFSLRWRDNNQNTRSQQDGYSFLARYEDDIRERLSMTLEGKGSYKVSRFYDPDGAFILGGSRLASRTPLGEASVTTRYGIAPGVNLGVLVGGSLEAFSQEDLDTGARLDVQPHATRMSGFIGAELQADLGKYFKSRAKYLHRYDLDTSGGFADGIIPLPAQSQSSLHPLADVELAFSPFQSLSLYSNAHYHSRNPDFFEKFGTSGYVFGTQTLEPETKRQLEAGIRLDGRFLKSSLAGTVGLTDNKIKAVGQSGGYFKMKNYAEIRHAGGEWNLAVTALPWLTISNLLTFTHSTMHNMGNAELEGNFEPLIPFFENRLDLDITYKGIRAGHRFHYLSDYFRGDHNEEVITHRPILDAYVGYDVSRFLTIRYRIENYLNVFNEDFPENFLPGRMHFLSINMTLAPPSKEEK